MRLPPHDGQKPRPLQGEGDDAVEPAAVAVHAHKAVGEDGGAVGSLYLPTLTTHSLPS
jgi:hypothetical protein